MVCPHCEGAAKVFTGRVADRELRRYRRKGPAKTTRILLDMIPVTAVQDGTLLDIGGGVGAIQHELAARGARHLTDVDASPAYLAAARSEAARRGYADRARHIQGDFAEIATQLGEAGIVTLDRVVCCYPYADRLLGAAATRARGHVGLVWPRDRWWVRWAGGAINLTMRLSRNPFRFRVHPDRVVEDALTVRGLTRRAYAKTGFWQVALYSRDHAA